MAFFPIARRGGGIPGGLGRIRALSSKGGKSRRSDDGGRGGDDGKPSKAGSAPEAKDGGKLRSESREKEQDKRLSPNRLFYPGQTYMPSELDPNAQPVHKPMMKSKSSQMFSKMQLARAVKQADFKAPMELKQLLSAEGLLLPRRKTKLRRKVHRAVEKEVKTSRCMGLLPHTGLPSGPGKA